MQRRALSQFFIPRDLYRRLFDEASASPEREICGLVGGSGEFAKSLYPVANISPTPATAFYMEPQGQIGAMRTMRDYSEDLVGIYHSHPTTRARPSPADREQAAYPGVAYLIISIADPEAPEVAAFVFDGEDFQDIALSVTGSPAGFR
jgi:proteasome lid subunit RPN8/RPN11